MRIVLPVLIAAAPLLAQAPSPGTPAGQKLKALVEHFNSGDAARIEKYCRENFSAELLKESPSEEFAQNLAGARKQLGELHVRSKELVDGHSLKAKLANKGEDYWTLLELAVSPEAPHKVTMLNLRPIPPPTAGESGTPVTKLTPVLRSKLLDAIFKGLANTYIDMEAAPAIRAHLEARLKAGAYDKLDNPSQFAEAVTQDLRKINGDLHLRLGFSPASPSARSAAPSSPAPAASDPAAAARQINFGLARAELLPGNVGYLEITKFEDGEGFKEAIANALRFLSNTEALIIDLRRNGGGGSDYSNLLVSHFLGATPVPTILFRTRNMAKPEPRLSLAEVPGPRRPDVPLFVLTSQGTASAAEGFSFVLKNKRRATLVGTRTAGAGRMVRDLQIGDGFTFGVSSTQVTDPETGREWEQVGVLPDIDVPAEKAPREAHAAALKRILAGTKNAGQVAELKRVIESVEASDRPTPPDARRLVRFEGIFAGREVAVKDGRLTFSRQKGAMAQELIHLSGNRFALGQTATQVIFEEKDGKLSLSVERADGTRVTYPRSEAK